MSAEPKVVYEDPDLAGIVKPSGMLTEGGGDSLESWAQNTWDERARCCHRLDRLTSGVVLIRKNRRLNRQLAALFEGHHIRKCYWALTACIWPRDITLIDLALGPQRNGRLQQADVNGKPAKTSVRVLGQSKNPEVTWLELILKTGRTHQARVHCASQNCPVLGDSDYGADPRSDLFGLHARELRFTHPLTREDVRIQVDPPESWMALLNQLEELKN